jgi:hypothetical protein
MKNKELLDISSDYLMSAFGQTTAQSGPLMKLTHIMSNFF